ncbi:helix-turn-helix domain-containing protein [Pimelobacter simplex]|uniref:helix-turn-helix domain-containing protein n=1 Tax=Nocardioides simplex TaxID=2045 RepID=UPI0021506584|nr:helix-turn-helix domain-containing protein [Pimelobacter simplex]UUW88428.1 helix-turn-helix domain-containing protein [Pimelobacter simplex]UUW97932.1 helix-turn-helix domain-containing protein [Pimelobacter simplex]
MTTRLSVTNGEPAKDHGLRVISVQRAAERLDCSRHHVYRLIAAGKLRAVEIKVSGARPKTRVYPEDLDAFIEANTRTA